MIALAIVATTSLGMIAVTSVVTQDLSDRSSALVANSMQSVIHVNTLRRRLVRLEQSTGATQDAIERQLAVELGMYAPLATGPGEAEELRRFETALERLIASPATSPDRALRFEQLAAILERLAEVNTRAARDTVTEIERSSRRLLGIQIAAAAVALLAAAIAAAMMIRSMMRKRALLTHDFETLEARNQDLVAFAGRAAHDLRGPLVPMRGYADLLTLGAQIDPTRIAERIRKATQRMTEIIDDLLVLSVSGHNTGGEAVVTEVVAEVVAELSEIEDAEVRIDVGTTRVACASSVLRRVLRNLLDNASKYRAPTRRLRITITALQVGSRIVLTIQDNGRGMSEEACSHAFEEFYRAPETRDEPGTGLGLAIVQRMIASLGGSCELTSELDRGTRITLQVPALEGEIARLPQDDRSKQSFS
jgi:signal transduction histidine kinase